MLILFIPMCMSHGTNLATASVLRELFNHFNPTPVCAWSVRLMRRFVFYLHMRSTSDRPQRRGRWNHSQADSWTHQHRTPSRVIWGGVIFTYSLQHFPTRNWDFAAAWGGHWFFKEVEKSMCHFCTSYIQTLTRCLAVQLAPPN